MFLAEMMRALVFGAYASAMISSMSDCRGGSVGKSEFVYGNVRVAPVPAVAMPKLCFSYQPFGILCLVPGSGTVCLGAAFPTGLRTG